MHDLSIVPLAAARRGAGKKLFFPVMPAAGETLPGYLLRNVEPNFLEGIRPMLDVAGVNVTLASNCIDNLGRVADQLREQFSVPSAAWAGLWGVEGAVGGRRRLGGVWLTPAQIESGKRRMPPSHRPGDPDNAIWMVRDLGFCPETWEMLVDRCPRRGCRPFTWMSATAFHKCGHCRTAVSDADRQTVPRRYRPTLTWVLGLFGDATEQERSVMALPPFFCARSPTDVYDLMLAIARPLRAMRDPSIHSRVVLKIADVVVACRFLLDFPRSHWDLHQRGDVHVSAFRKSLEAHLRFSLRPAVRDNLIKILQYGRPGKGKINPSWRAEWLSITQAAGLLRVERCVVRSLVNAGFLLERTRIGGEHRTHSSFQKAHVERIRDELRAQMSLREFQSRTGLPRSAVEQLLGLGLIAETTNTASKLVHGGLHITRDSAEAFMSQVAGAVTLEHHDGDVPLREVMRGVGGRPKPWARLLAAAVEGELPGGLRGRPDGRIVDLTVHAVTARHLLMGGAGDGQAFAFQAGDLGHYERPELAPSEVEEHINCTAQDVSWLRSRKYLASISANGEATRYCRLEVETLGRQLVTTREIAARTGKPAPQLWPELQDFSAGGSLGQGFYDRGLIEAWIKASL